MGEFRKYRPYYAINALRFNGGAYNNNWHNTEPLYAYDDSKTRVPNFKDIIGTEYGWLKTLASACAMYNPSSSKTISVSGVASTVVRQGEWICYQYQPFIALTPFATEDVISNYAVDDYEINSVGRVDFTRAHFVGEDINKILYSMSIFNDNQDQYVRNESQYWDVNKTYYALIDGEYVAIYEEPVDWITTYSDYYLLELAEDITVSCIKFRIPMMADTSASRSYEHAREQESEKSSLHVSNYSGVAPIFSLFCSYFLDEPIIIHPGDSHLLALSFESSQF